ncbi:MAG: glucose/arabinose dehydrogenase [Pseudohongiellaceae bacterium]|jgi:glucose/arabinose dehydrogenase
MIRRALLTLTSVAALMAAATTLVQAEEYHSKAHTFETTQIADGLEVPWSMAWLPNGDMLVTERPGRLRIIRNGSLLAAPVEGVPAVHHQGQGGLFDVVPHPDFASNKLVYLSFAKPLGEGSTTAVVRGTFENDRLANVETIFEADTAGRDGHYGARIVFDGDGYLFISIGDRQASPSGDLAAHASQDLTNHNGTVVRLHDDGRVPSDNPFVGRRDALPEIYSFGHRNPQSLTLNPITGDLWAGEHGPQGGDELNIVNPGVNYGWPVVGYGVNYGPGRPIHATQEQEGMEGPKHYWVPSIATSGLMIYGGDLFPNWKGDAFVGGLRGQLLARVDINDAGDMAISDESLMVGIGRVRDVREGPDGAIYVATENRGILRLTPAD